MRKIGLLCVVVCLGSLYICAQTCEELTTEFEFLEAKYKKLEETTEKKDCVRKMELVIRRGKEANCEFPQKWHKEINQWKKELYPSSIFTQGNYTFDADNGVLKVGVNQKKNLQISGKPNWLELLETEDSKNFEFSVSENELPYPRIGIVEVYDGKNQHQCYVTQEAAPLQVKVTENIGFGQDGGASFIFVETNDTAWIVDGGAEWLTTELTDYGARVACRANPTKQKRSSRIYVHLAYGETRVVNISQAIGRTTLTVPKKSFTFSNYGEKNNNVEVKCNYDQWSATSDASWVKVKKKYGGISVECLPNSVATSRSATIKIETNDVEHLVEYISVTQKEAPPYLRAEQSSYCTDGYERTVYVNVNTNIPNWSYSVEKGSSWTTASKSGKNLRVYLRRNDWNSSRISEIKLYGKGESFTVSMYQPNRGYAGRYRDYFDANGGDWHVTWLEADFHIMTTMGINIATMNARWQAVELSLLNFNLDYNFLWGDAEFGWEPVIRGFLPVSRDGKWAAFVGMGAHLGIESYSAFLLEFGMECIWNGKYSSRMFFKYNGACSIGMSFSFGTWY